MTQLVGAVIIYGLAAYGAMTLIQKRIALHKKLNEAVMRAEMK